MHYSEERKSHIKTVRRKIVGQYSQRWSDFFSEWIAEDDRTLGWMMYSANYLFRTRSIRWAVDPFLLSSRISGSQSDLPFSQLNKLNFVLLTHRHNDHFDPNLIHALSKTSSFWVLPVELLSDVLALEINPERIIIAKPGETIDCFGFQILPFSSLHFAVEHESILHGVPESGYLVEFEGKKWLFPGDIRNFQAEQLPAFGRLDVVFAHLWLGRKSANLQPPPLLEEFCQFFLSFEPSRVIVTHLYEFGRKSNNLWDLTHYQMVKDRIQMLNSTISVGVALTGQEIPI